MPGTALLLSALAGAFAGRRLLSEPARGKVKRAYDAYAPAAGLALLALVVAGTFILHTPDYALVYCAAALAWSAAAGARLPWRWWPCALAGALAGLCAVAGKAPVEMAAALVFGIPLLLSPLGACGVFEWMVRRRGARWLALLLLLPALWVGISAVRKGPADAASVGFAWCVLLCLGFLCRCIPSWRTPLWGRWAGALALMVLATDVGCARAPALYRATGHRWAAAGLAAALRSPDSGIRLSAVREADDDAFAEQLAASLHDPDPQVRRAATLTLAALGDDRALSMLQVAAWHDGRDAARATAADAIGRSKDRRALPTLIGCLSVASPAVRPCAAAGLGRLRAHEALPALIIALKDPEPQVREAACKALGQITDPQSVDALQAVADHDSNRDVRQSAGDALASLRARSDGPRLIANLMTSPGSRTRRLAADELGRTRDERAVPALLAAMADNASDVRSSAIQALGRIGDPRATPALIAALKEPRTRPAATLALGEMRDPHALPALREVQASNAFAVDGAAAIRSIKQALGTAQ